MSVPSAVPVPPAAQSTAAEPELPDAPPSEPSVRRNLTTQELRLALTFTGGVSLAVWMGGVAREVDLLVQASDARVGLPAVTAPPLQPREQSVVDLYRALLDVMDVEVSVDVLSGTSAGGINAALLGLANSQRLSLVGLRKTWLDMGALGDLLRDPRLPNPPSLLQGDGKLLAGLHQAIAAMHQSRDNEAVDGPSASDTRQTDVFITTTLLSAEINRFTDDFGTEITDANHHGQFHFNEQTMAAKEAVAALALAARSSASFPGAFEPAFVPVGQSGSDDLHPDMARYSNTTRSHWAADGGLLVNRPIGPLLQSIFDRGADREVRRALLYVVPSSRLLAESPPDLPTESLGLAGALVHDLAATLSQSIAADLAAISEHNDRTRSVGDTRLRLATLGADLKGSRRLADDAAWRDYRQRQSDWLATPLISEITRQLAIIGSLPGDWSQLVGTRRDTAMLRAASAQVRAGWPTALPDGSQAASLGLSAFDSAKATLLRMLRLGYVLARTETDRRSLAAIATQIKEALKERRTADLRTLVGTGLGAEIRQSQQPDLLSAVTTVATNYVNRLVPDTLPTAWAAIDTIAGTAGPLLQSLLANASAVDPTAAAGSMQQRRANAAAELSTYLRYLGEDQWPTGLLDLHVVVRSVLPVLVEVEQPVQLVQVSADTRTLLDPQRRTAASKLTGLQMHHFGAFYKATWRANDWMWGRLDGCGWLVHVLLDPRRVIAVLENDEVEPAQRVVAFKQRLLTALGRDTMPAAVERSLAFLGDDTVEVPTSLPALALWVASAPQEHIAADELTCVAANLEPGKEGVPSGPAKSWLATFTEAKATPDPQARVTAMAHTLAACPVASETLESEVGSPLFLRTLTRMVAVGTSAATSMKSPPASLRPTFATARSITQTAYVATDQTHGKRQWMALAGVAGLVVGVLAMLQDSVWFGLPGLVLFGTGALLLAFCVGKGLPRVLTAALTFAVVLLAAAPWLPYIDSRLYSWMLKTLVPWLHRERWVWPAFVLLLLLPPAMSVVGVRRQLVAAARRRRAAQAVAPQPTPFDPYVGGPEDRPAVVTQEPDRVAH
ncbi:patatin-like protein [Acidothermaceae bacterium B102]|nr:patatin-like protein [Acidothermaceae bacterium B102]